jgi:hypothetical protein
VQFCFCGGNPIYFPSSGCPPMDQSPLSHLRIPHSLFMEAIGHLVTWMKVQGENDLPSGIYGLSLSPHSSL